MVHPVVHLEDTVLCDAEILLQRRENLSVVIRVARVAAVDVDETYVQGSEILSEQVVHLPYGHVGHHALRVVHNERDTGLVVPAVGQGEQSVPVYLSEQRIEVGKHDCAGESADVGRGLLLQHLKDRGEVVVLVSLQSGACELRVPDQEQSGHGEGVVVEEG